MSNSIEIPQIIPCICGSSNQFVAFSRRNETSDLVFAVVCDDCENKSDGCRDSNEAIETWNKKMVSLMVENKGEE